MVNLYNGFLRSVSESHMSHYILGTRDSWKKNTIKLKTFIKVIY